MSMQNYYSARAVEYEAVYAKPERQSDLLRLRHTIPLKFSGKRVLEIACGTGYWTQFIAEYAATVAGIDHSSAVLALARAKQYGTCPVMFSEVNAYGLHGLPVDFDAAFAGFWWSHIPKCRRDEFLRTLHTHLEVGSTVVLLDNRYVDGSSTLLSRSDEEGNTYQIRKLRDGSQHEVLKNFPTRAEVESVIAKYAREVTTTELEYFWYVEYILS